MKIKAIISIILSLLIIMAAVTVIKKISDKAFDISGNLKNIVGVDTTTETKAKTTTTENGTTSTSSSVNQATCAHTYVNGTCTKCGLVCCHTTKTTATNGNKYCSACNMLISLKTPVITKTGNKIEWTANAESGCYYTVIQNSTNVLNTTNNFYYVEDENLNAGTNTFKIKAYKIVNNNLVSSEDSNSVTYTGNYYVNVRPDNTFTSSAEEISSYTSGGTAIIVITPAPGYKLKDTIRVQTVSYTNGHNTYTTASASSYTYDKTTGTITIVNISNNYVIDNLTESEGTACAAPVISLSNGYELQWSAVDGATVYHIYVNNEYHASTSDTYYEILPTSAGMYAYTVKAGTNESYKLSANSNTIYTQAYNVSYIGNNYERVKANSDINTAMKNAHYDVQIKAATGHILTSITPYINGTALESAAYTSSIVNGYTYFKIDKQYVTGDITIKVVTN